MFKYFNNYLLVCIVSAVVGHSAVAPVPALAEDTVLSVSGDNVLHENLEKLKGKKVTLRLTAGDELTGTVKALSNQAVHLAELSGREFFDGVVPLDKVVAIVVRAR